MGAKAPAPQGKSLGRKTLFGLGWMSIGTGSQSVLQIVVLAILARLVSPEDFGVVGAALVAVSVSIIFSESGIGPAIVQRPNLDERHIRVGFTLQFGVALLLWGLFLLVPEQVASLFSIDQLSPVLPVITFVFVLRAMTVGDYLLLRNLRFKALSMIELVSYVLGYGLISVVMALRGYGVWALVAGHVGQNVIRTTALWIFAPHSPRLLLDGAALRDLLGYGSGNTLGTIANYIARNGDNFVVSRYLGAAPLGFYSRAYQLMVMPAHLFGQVLNNVMFPAMSAVQDHVGKLRRAYLQGVTLIAMAALPFSVVAVMLSPEMILVLLGPDWLPLQGAFNILAFGMLFRTSYKLSDCLAKATGAVYRRAWRQFLYAGLVVGGAFLGYRAGLEGVSLGILVALAVNFGLMAQLSLRLVQASWGSFLAAHAPAVMISAVVALVIWPTATVLREADAGPVLTLAGCIAVAGLAVLLLGRLAPYVSPAKRLTDTLRNLLDVLGNSKPRRALSLLLGPRYAATGTTPLQGAV